MIAKTQIYVLETWKGICKLQQFNSWVLGGAVMVWRGMGSTSLETVHISKVTSSIIACYFLPVGKLLFHGQMAGDEVSWETLEERISGMMVLKTELKSMSRGNQGAAGCSAVLCWLHPPLRCLSWLRCLSLNKQQMVQQMSCHALQVRQHQSFKGPHYHRYESNKPVEM